MQPMPLCSPQKLCFFYSHSRLELTWQGTRKPLGGLMPISVIASPTVKPAATLRAADQASVARAHLALCQDPRCTFGLTP